MEQRILSGKEQYEELDKWLTDNNALLVCGRSGHYSNKIKEVLNKHKNITYFSEYSPNPKFESVFQGIEVYRKSNCNAVMAIGGGSALDVAKCIKAFATMPDTQDYLDQEIKDNGIPLLVIPTTAGTGSEATRFAVIYRDEQKHSVNSAYCVPDVVLFDPDNLKGLPLYQRKATMMDALAHSLESLWSVNSTKESIDYSKKAIRLIKSHLHGYLDDTDEGNAGMQEAAFIAGKAINITQTTAGHAMCYKITGLFGCAHGHAAMMCNRKLLPWMLEHMDKCIDTRGAEYLKDTFNALGEVLDLRDAHEASQYIEHLYDELELEVPVPNEEQLRIMTKSVNVERLKNNPVKLEEQDIAELYRIIFEVN